MNLVKKDKYYGYSVSILKGLLTLFIFQGVLVAQQDKLDSLNGILLTSSDDSARISALIEVSTVLEGIDPDTVYSLCESAVDIAMIRIINAEGADKKAFMALKSAAIFQLGDAYMNSGDAKKALEYFEESLDISKELDDSVRMAGTIGTMGLIYYNYGEIQKGINFQETALGIQIRANDKNGMADTYNNLAMIYDTQGDQEQTLGYYNKSIEIINELKDQEGLSVVMHNRGIHLESHGQRDAALRDYLKALVVMKQLNYNYGLSFCYSTLGAFYAYYTKEGVKRPDTLSIDEARSEALHYFELGLQISESCNLKEGVFFSLGSIADLLWSMDNKKDALECAERAHAVSLSVGYPSQIAATSIRLENYYETKGRTSEAYAMFKLHVKMRDSIQRVDYQQELLRTEMKKQFSEDKAALLMEQEKKDAIASATIEHDENIKKLMAFALLLFLWGGAFIINRLRIIRSQKVLIEEAKIEVDEKNELLAQEKSVVEAQRTKWLESLNFASVVQNSILPQPDTLGKYFKDYFIYYRAKDVVSGDFYWFHRIRGRSYLAIVDCTGHGVPGALITMAGHGMLNQLFKEESHPHLGQVLTDMNSRIFEVFSKNLGGASIGMDITLVSFDHEARILRYAGCNNHLYLHDGTELNMLKVGGKPIGSVSTFYQKDDFKYEEEERTLPRGSVLYIMTDGYLDQFGEVDGKRKKYGRPQMRHVLADIAKRPMIDQLKMIDGNMDQWRGDFPQIDDQLVVGLKI